MGVVNTKSTIITNGDATPPALTGSFINGGRLQEQAAKVSVESADDNNSVYRMFRVPSNARVSQLLIKNDAITNGTDFNIGIYDTAENGGAVIDDNCFADAVDLSSANNVYTDLSQIDETNAEKQIWELAGLSSDPRKLVDVCLTGIAVGSAQGDIAGLFRYVI